MASKRFERKLRALKYPAWAQFKIDSMDSIKDLVFFLENTKIRAKLEADRASLKPEVKTNIWYNSLSEYLTEMETCPYCVCTKQSDMTQSDWIEIIEWLVSQAILVDFEDNKYDYNKNKPIRRLQRKNYQLSKCETAECKKALQNLCELLQVPNNDDNLITAESLYTLISIKFNSQALANYNQALEEAQNSKDDGKTVMHDPFDQIKNYKDIIKLYSHYEGFKTGDEKVDAAAIILKILYILDVRGLQNQLNEIVTFIQRFTANPRTNTKLGKVGY